MSVKRSADAIRPLVVPLIAIAIAISAIDADSRVGASGGAGNYASFPAEENGTCYKRVPYDDIVAERIAQGIVKAVPGSPPPGVKTRGGNRAWISVIDCCDGYVRNNDTGKCETHCEDGCVGGTCTGPNVCTCEDGWRAEAGVCRAICRRGCPRDAYCISPDVCTCQFGYAGDVEDCQPVCVGGCSNGDCVGPHDCRCHRGYYLNETQQCAPICRGGCPHGECTEPRVCTCNKGYLNPPHDLESCVPDCPKTCDNGECFSPGVCTCRPGYSLSANESCTPVCDKKCTNGQCIAPNQCSCEPGFVMNYRLGECTPVNTDIRLRIPDTTTVRSRDPFDPEYITPVPAVIGLNSESNQTEHPAPNRGGYENQGIPFVQDANRADHVHGTSGSYGNQPNNRTYDQRRPVSSQNQRPNARENNRPYGSYGRDQNEDVQRTVNSQGQSAIDRPDKFDITEENNAPFLANRNNPVTDRPRTRHPPGTYSSDQNPYSHDSTNSRINSRNHPSQDPQRSYPQGPFPIPTSEESEIPQQNHETHSTYGNNQENIRPHGRYPPQGYHTTQAPNSQDGSSPHPNYENNHRLNPQRPPSSQRHFPTPETDQSENPEQDNYGNNPVNARPHGRYPPHGYHPTQPQTSDPRDPNNPRVIYRNDQRPTSQRPSTSQGPYPRLPPDQSENSQTDNYENHPENVTPPGQYPGNHPIRRPAQTQRPQDTHSPQPTDAPERNNNPQETPTDSHSYHAQRPATSLRPPPARAYPPRGSHGNNYPYDGQDINNSSRSPVNNKPYIRPNFAEIPVYSGVDLTYGTGEIFIVPGEDVPFTIQGPIQTQLVYGPYNYPPPLNADPANQGLSSRHGVPEVSVTFGRPVGNSDVRSSFPKEPSGANQAGPLCSMPCLNGECVGPNRCACKRGYQLDTNSPFANACAPVCYGGCPNGVCTAPNLCLCNFGFIKEYGIKGVQRCVPVV